MKIPDNELAPLCERVKLAGQCAAALKNGAAAIVPTAFDWAGLVLICFVLPAVLSVVFCEICRRLGWIKENDLKLPS